MSLLQSVVPSCFKNSIIVPVPKMPKTLCLNDYHPVALTIMKCFERLVKSFITSSLPDSLDPLQFVYRPNRSTDDAISLTLYTALSYLDQRDTYLRMLFIDYSIQYHCALEARHQAQRPWAQHCPLCLDPELPDGQTLECVDRQHHILHPDSKHRCPSGLLLSYLLYSLFTYDCVATYSSNTIVKFADDTTVIGLITVNDETAYRQEVRVLTSSCQNNNLHLNISKRKATGRKTRPPLHQWDYSGESQP